MYTRFFGLQHEPFSIAPDPRYLFMSERHREALAHLLYGVRAGGGFVLLTGEIGAGKTTVCRCFLEQVPKRCHVAYIFNPRLTATELLQSVCDEFRIPYKAETPRSAKDYIDPLNDFLLKTHAVGQNCLLIIDEAQQLSADVLEQLRLLTNLETNERKLLQIVLIGQPELRTMLAKPELEQLAQRVIARYHLGALSEADTTRYIRHRLAVAGLVSRLPFDREALKQIHRLSRGIPRRINMLADRALLGTYSAGKSVVGRETVETAATEVFEGETLPGQRVRRRFASLVGLGVTAGALLLGGLIWATLGGGSGSATSTASTASTATTTTTATTATAPPAPPAASSPAAQAVQPASAAGTGSAVPVLPPAVSPTAALPAEPGRKELTGRAAEAVALARSQTAAASRADSTGGAAGEWFATEAEAWRALAPRWQLALADGAEPCAAAALQQTRCWRARTTLAVVRRLDRPGILTLKGDQGQTVYALLTGLSSHSATLRSGGDAQSLPLAELSRRWQGDFATFWRAPAGYSERSSDLQAGPLADWVSAQLTAVAGSSAAAGSQDLRTRVAAFQSSQGLTADGLAGPATLMSLNRAVGIAEPRLVTSTLAAN
jgi:general secretion pathway protein A